MSDRLVGTENTAPRCDDCDGTVGSSGDVVLCRHCWNRLKGGVDQRDRDRVDTLLRQAVGVAADLARLLPEATRVLDAYAKHPQARACGVLVPSAPGTFHRACALPAGHRGPHGAVSGPNAGVTRESVIFEAIDRMTPEQRNAIVAAASQATGFGGVTTTLEGAPTLSGETAGEAPGVEKP